MQAENQMFSTLDPVTRRIHLPSGGDLLITDTVGFIQKLSPLVVASFRATLEELAESDVLLHVIDITHPKAPEQAEVVEVTLRELKLSDKPRLLVVNKMDLLTEKPDSMTNLLPPGLDGLASVFVSAAKGWNLDLLLEKIEAELMDIEGPLTVVSSAAGD